MARVSCIHKTATSCTPSATIYSTITAWEASIDRATNGDEIAVICDAATYVGVNLFSIATSGTSVVRLTANDGAMFTHIDGSPVGSVRGDGTFEDGATISDTTGGPLFETQGCDYTVIDHLCFLMDTNNSHGIRVQSDHVAIINCTFESVADADDLSGIEIREGNTPVLIDGCSFLECSLAGIHYNQANASGAVTDAFLAVHNAGYQGTNVNNHALASFIYLGQNSVNATLTATVHNNIGGTTERNGGRAASWVDGNSTHRRSPDGTLTWNGSYNFDDGEGYADIDGTNNTTNWIAGSADPSTVDTTQTSGTYWVVDDLTVGSTASFIPLDAAAGNAIIAAGLATASLPSAGSTFLNDWWETVNESGAIDKRGYRRLASAPDIGPYSFEDHAPAADLAFIPQALSV